MDWATILVAVITAGFAFLGVYMSNRKQAALMAGNAGDDPFRSPGTLVPAERRIARAAMSLR